jgi:MoaA/NifB/PqqE/SkfB family radical SAM enzyme
MVSTTPTSAGPACAAPFSSLYLDQRGNVRVCCVNSAHPLGNVGNERLSAMWAGEKISQLRSALQSHDYSLGCRLCRPPTGMRLHPTAPARSFDVYAGATPGDWPRQLELALSNSCNLECEMCFGELSSSIRSNREGLDPLPAVYGDEFFEDLDPFLPHVERINFIGGEPFLSREAWRLWQRLDELGLYPQCHVTTNATIRNRRVDWVLDRFPVSFTVSIDGATADSYERIRRGAVFAEVLENLDHFRSVAARTGSGLSLAFCLSSATWRELPEMLMFGDVRGLDVGVNLVTEPARLSLWRAQADVLDEVAETWTRQRDTVASQLHQNRSRWLENVEWAVSAAEQARRDAENANVRLGSPEAIEAARMLACDHAAGGPVLEVDIDDQDRMLAFRGAAAFVSAFDIDPSPLSGRPFIALMSGPVVDRFGAAFTSEVDDRSGRAVRFHRMSFATDPPTTVQVTTAPAGVDRTSTGRAFLSVCRDSQRAAQPVAPPSRRRRRNRP